MLMVKTHLNYGIKGDLISPTDSLELCDTKSNQQDFVISNTHQDADFEMSFG